MNILFLETYNSPTEVCLEQGFKKFTSRKGLFYLSYAAVSIHKSFTYHIPSNPTQDLDHVLTLQNRRFGKI